MIYILHNFIIKMIVKKINLVIKNCNKKKKYFF